MVPQFAEVALQHDGIPREAFWRQARKITDFRTFRSAQAPAVKTEALLCLDRDNLCLGLVCEEPKGVNKTVKRNSLEANPWAGDNVEIFFAGLKPRDWYRQIVLGANGEFYNEYIQNDEYVSVIHTDKDRWSAEVVIPLKCLGEFDGAKCDSTYCA